jgi:SNF2 family DNA or RNA helicase
MKLTADMSGEERFKIQELFNATPKCILIGSTLAMGEGLNLQTCADCVMHERQWNPANEEQAEGRFIRIGQQHANVNATYVEAEGTVDEILDGIIERKRVMFHDSMNKGQLQGWSQGDIVKEVAASIVSKFNQQNKNKKVTKVG